MKVKILVGAHAYACITHATGSMDVQLAAGHSPEFSLAQSARELREKAESMIRRADILDQAAGYLVAQKEKAA